MSKRAFLLALVSIFVVATTLRTLWLTADTPTQASAGVVWHDEGAWVHNARNRALWGVWRTDNWNPVFVAPVFTGLEYAAFRVFGVGTWQARTVPVVSGLVAVGFLIAGLSATAGRRAALIGGLLLATDYIFVMWNRAALMESTMTAFIVVGWAAYAMAEKRPRWGLLAGMAVVLAWFTKASAAFFLASIVLDAILTLALARWQTAARPDRQSVRAAIFTLAGIAISGAVVMALFVLPHWADYRFYNYVMSVVRKPSYDLASLVDRASWLPIAQDFFTRMWLVVAVAAVAICGIVARWRTARPAERVLVLWVFLGVLELVVHNTGEERYYVMLGPALIALAALIFAAPAPILPGALAAATGRGRWLALPLVLFLGYLVFGSALRIAFEDEVRAGIYRHAVWLAAGLAVLVGALILSRWHGTVLWLSRVRVSPAAVAVFLVLAVGWNLVQYGRWTRVRRDDNYRASIEVGRLLAPGTLVHGKLANGLSLENRIRPIFIGVGFGNYADRLQRDDARYILTYVSPRLGYESPRGLIQEVLDHYANCRVVATFDVDETGGSDRAALMDKRPEQDDAGSRPLCRDLKKTTPEVDSGMDRARD